MTFPLIGERSSGVGDDFDDQFLYSHGSDRMDSSGRKKRARKARRKHSSPRKQARRHSTHRRRRTSRGRGHRGRRGIMHTKNGQPYIIMPNGRAKFIKRRS